MPEINYTEYANRKVYDAMKYVEDHDIKQRVEYNANAALEKTKNIGKSLWARAKTLTLKGKKTEEEKSTDDNSQDQIQSIEAE